MMDANAVVRVAKAEVVHADLTAKTAIARIRE